MINEWKLLSQRVNHEKAKMELIKEIESRIKIIKELNNETEDEKMQNYYIGYIRAYNECINLIKIDKYY